MNAKLRVAAYARVSTDKDDQRNSLESQKQFFKEYIENNPDWKLVDVYYDEGLSGTTFKKRQGFNRMISDAKSGRMDLIITKEVSRFARNTVHTLNCAQELKAVGVGILFYNDNLDTRKGEDEFRLTIMAGVAQEESRRTSERVKWGQEQRMKKGVVFGRDLLGYTVKGGQLFINEPEAEIVRLIYHKFLHESKGTHVIARELWEAGIRPKRVKQWANTVILRVLRNEKYVGDLLQKKTFTPDYLTHDKKYNRGSEEQIYIQNHHEPIIERETWDAVQAELARRALCAARKSKHSNRYWCSGKLICGECGAKLVSRTRKTKSGTYQAWRCSRSASHGTRKADRFGNMIGCDSASVNDKALACCTGYVIQQIPLDQSRITNELLRDIKNVLSSGQAVDTSRWDRQVQELKAEKVAVIRQGAKGIVSDGDIRLAVQACDEEIKALQDKISKAMHQNDIRMQQADALSAYGIAIQQILSRETSDEMVCRELVREILVCNGNILVIWLDSIPFGMRLRYAASGRGDNYLVMVEWAEPTSLPSNFMP